MAEYIEREALIEAVRYYQYPYGVEFLVRCQPAADVVEVKRGFWKPYQTPLYSRQTGWLCTNCSGVQSGLSNGNTNYCPNCGAFMENWEDEDATD